MDRVELTARAAWSAASRRYSGSPVWAVLDGAILALLLWGLL